MAAITNFQLSGFLADAGATGPTGSAVINGKTLDNANGKNLAITGTGTIQSDGSNLGVALKDFEAFRVALQNSNAVLQAKIDQILNTNTVGC